MGNEPPEVARARLVSVTISTYNEEAALPFTLESVFKQTYPFIEVIVVDSHSSDKTKDIALGFDTKVIDYDGKLLGARCADFKEHLIGAREIYFRPTFDNTKRGTM